MTQYNTQAQNSLIIYSVFLALLGLSVVSALRLPQNNNNNINKIKNNNEKDNEISRNIQSSDMMTNINSNFNIKLNKNNKNFKNEEMSLKNHLLSKHQKRSSDDFEPEPMSEVSMCIMGCAQCARASDLAATFPVRQNNGLFFLNIFS
jgi:hypothetical protein